MAYPFKDINMKLTANSLVIGNKTYNLEDSKYAFMDAVTAICTVLCSAMAGADAKYDMSMTLPLQEDNEARFSAALDGCHATLRLNDENIEEGDISELVKTFIQSAKLASEEYVSKIAGGFIHNEIASEIQDDLDTLADTLEEFESECSGRE